MWLGVTVLLLVGRLGQSVHVGQTHYKPGASRASELSLTWTLALVPFLSFACDISIEIGAFFFTLPFPLLNNFRTSDAVMRSTYEL